MNNLTSFSNATKVGSCHSLRMLLVGGLELNMEREVAACIGTLIVVLNCKNMEPFMAHHNLHLES